MTRRGRKPIRQATKEDGPQVALSSLHRGEAGSQVGTIRVSGVRGPKSGAWWWISRTDTRASSRSHTRDTCRHGLVRNVWIEHGTLNRALSRPQAAFPPRANLLEICGGTFTRGKTAWRGTNSRESARVMPGRSRASLGKCSSGEACNTTVAQRMRAAKLVFPAFH